MHSIRGRIASFKRGLNRQNQREVIVRFDESLPLNEVAKLVGAKVTWVSPKGQRFVGSVLRPHGRGGGLLVRFRKPLPGLALGSKVELS